MRDEPFENAPYVVRYDQGGKAIEVDGQLDGDGGYAPTSSGEFDDATLAALAMFQREELGRKEATGEPDAETCAELEKAYGV